MTRSAFPSNALPSLVLAGVTFACASTWLGAGCSSFTSEEPADPPDGAQAADGDAVLDAGAEGATPESGPFADAVLLFDDDGGAVALALDSANVYWGGLPPPVDGGERSRVRKRAKAGGQVSYLPSSVSAGPNVTSIAPSVSRVVWAAGNGSCTNDGIAAVSTTEDGYRPLDCAGRLYQTGAAVYSASPKSVSVDAGEIWRFDKGKSLSLGNSLVARGAFTGPVVSDEQNVYAATATGIVKLALPAGGSAAMLQAVGQVVDMALDGTELIVATPTTLSVVDLTLDVSVSPVSLATAVHVLRIAIDATSVYWIDADAAKVMRVSRAGGPIESLASTQGDPSAIAVDDRAVYWSTFEGKVFTLPRR